MENLSIFDSNIHLLKKTLDLRSANQRVIASNIANADTPGYAPARFEFEQELQQAIQGKGLVQNTHPDHIPIGASDLSSVTGTGYQGAGHKRNRRSKRGQAWTRR